MKGLTERQKEILNLIKSDLRNKGFPPTRADIANALGFKLDCLISFIELFPPQIILTSHNKER